jgi:hypothetical protein
MIMSVSLRLFCVILGRLSGKTRLVISDWTDHYNHDRPHSRLDNQPPAAVRYPALNTPTLTQVDQTKGSRQSTGRPDETSSLPGARFDKVPAPVLSWLTQIGGSVRSFLGPDSSPGLDVPPRRYRRQE